MLCTKHYLLFVLIYLSYNGRSRSYNRCPKSGKSERLRINLQDLSPKFLIENVWLSKDPLSLFIRHLNENKIYNYSRGVELLRSY